MPQVIQKTKLFLPPARARSVERPRLLAQADALLAEGCRAALVCAPAGFGKTTFAVQWLARRQIPVGWLSLDERDNLPERFFHYLIAALQAVVPGAGVAAGALLALPGAGIEELVSLLANDLTAAQGLFALVLDDFHAITNPLLHQAVDLLIEAQPPQMRLVLLAREDPSIQLARRRARGQIVEIRQAELAFTREEAAAFIEQSMGLRLTSAQIQALETRTEGWAAGLQMAALALQGPLAPQGPLLDDPAAIATEARVDRFLHDFSGSHHFILDYLMEEVLARQDAEVQDFLLETAILERMQSGLCAAVTGKTPAESQRLLEQIARANLFVIPLDGERRWYRYHHLFGDLLRARLHAERPQDVPALYRSASVWLEANGDSRLAVAYALQAEDYPQAANLLERHMTERWQTVDLEFFKLLERLPFAVVAERPALCLQSAWLCVLYGQTGRILPFVEAAERALAQAGTADAATAATQRAFARTLRAYVADLHNQPVALDDALAQAYAAIPETNPGMRNSVAVVIGMICFMEGDFAAALRYYEDALALDQRVNGTNAVPIATTRICFVLQAQGRLREAMRRLEEAGRYVRERGIRRFYISGSLYQRMADLLLEWNQLDTAEERLQEGTRLLADWLPVSSGLGLVQRVRLRAARGDLAGAREALALAEENARQTGLHPFFLDALEQARLGLFLLENNLPALAEWAKENDYYRELPLSFRYEARQVGLCRAWLALGMQEPALRLLEQLAESARDRSGSRIPILLLLAVANQQNLEPALEFLEQALRLAEPEGYLRVFLETGAPLLALLRHWLAHGPASDDPRLRAYARSILAAADGLAEAAAQPQDLLPEPLSPREQEVLALMAQGLTNQQIADRLVISVRTVKKHVENIHGKLGVANRTQAVARARALGLLA